MTWIKQGLVLGAPLAPAWAVSHAAVPTLDETTDELYVATRDQDGHSWIARALLDLVGGRPRVARVDPDPALTPGALGAFDDAGVTPSCIVRAGAETRLYYTGWSRGVSVPFYLAIGLAISREGGPFERVSEAPILGRTAADPFLTASPHVLHDGERWRMWYVSCTHWEQRPDGVRHHYHLRHRSSPDGIDWSGPSTVAVDFASADEYAFSRPCVRAHRDGLEMWFSVRGDSYRLGYARSADGLSWERDDDAAGLDRSPDGWDAEMVAYPYVFARGGNVHLLYNGNGYGQTGVGAAIAA